MNWTQNELNLSQHLGVQISIKKRNYVCRSEFIKRAFWRGIELKKIEYNSGKKHQKHFKGKNNSKQNQIFFFHCCLSAARNPQLTQKPSQSESQSHKRKWYVVGGKDRNRVYSNRENSNRMSLFIR